MKRILVVDDDLQGLESTRRILEWAGYEVVTASGAQEALDIVRSKDFSGLQAILTDVRMPRMSGLEFLKALSVISCRIPVILMTAYGNVEDAVWAMKLGAVDFLSKPFKKKQLLDAVSVALSRSVPTVSSEPSVRSSKMAALRDQILKVASANTTILVQGESGVGKERIAREIHDLSPRAHRAFVAINCAAIPENLLESELFGFEKGAFSGAGHAKPGLFESASGGTLLLDEIGDMPLVLQSKLLRVLQEGEIRRLGSTRSTRVDVRLVAATHQDLRALVAAGRFREDLLYRLEVIVLQVPALRDRPEDILALAEHILQKCAETHGKAITGFSEQAKLLLQSHSWPGNIRELSNAIERAVVLSSGHLIEPSDLPATLRPSDIGVFPSLSSTETSISIPLGTALKDVEELLIRRTLEATDGDKAMTARLLGITSRTIYRKLDRRDGEPNA
ncbi:MAG: sigma-54 dependent transcriptional regulator [Bdellovibrionales bacterium]|nr:sigma-54 dependent transcriptional regulator [Bdellovibrionales bacterium]